MTEEKQPKNLKFIIDYIANAMQEKTTGKITIDLHEGGVRDLSINKKVKLSKINP
jgi:hypothetical protein